MNIKKIDNSIRNFFSKNTTLVARLSIFIVFFWFGFLKIIGLSPASPLVELLFIETISFMDFGLFLILFGVFECIIGILFIIPGFERFVIPLLFLHLFTTVGPLFLVPESTWQSFFVPTLEGQYIIKNVLIVAVVIGIAGHLRPIKK